MLCIYSPNKIKGFTLIELLVVVAIIGILAAVGVIAYNVYISATRAIVAKSNQKSVIKWIAAEAQKCQLGFDIIMNGEVSCDAISVAISTGGNPAGTTVMAIQTALEGQFRNPYGANLASVW